MVTNYLVINITLNESLDYKITVIDAHLDFYPCQLSGKIVSMMNHINKCMYFTAITLLIPISVMPHQEMVTIESDGQAGKSHDRNRLN